MVPNAPVVILLVVVMACGAYPFQQLPIDAYPDISGQG
jgi:Cu/Ag efflux pump CusA